MEELEWMKIQTPQEKLEQLKKENAELKLSLEIAKLEAENKDIRNQIDILTNTRTDRSGQKYVWNYL